ncbi:hypothetical protein HQQ80_19890 [Microbacteriaceae bacterium VKM Ac-2855]|nr:hypothetical protein [Microbacteriaceae bacterium VKM Ac-2855]
MIELVLEVVWIIGVGLAAVCLFLWLVVRAVDGRWIETTGVLIDNGGRPGIRWMTEDGRVFGRMLDGHERRELGDVESASIRYREADPERMRLHPQSEPERVLRLLTFVLGGVGIVCLVASTALMIFA